MLEAPTKVVYIGVWRDYRQGGFVLHPILALECRLAVTLVGDSGEQEEEAAAAYGGESGGWKRQQLLCC